jgi:formamidopyrimidine-DNA glycosylase
MLMNQELMAGIGNIYSDEIMFQAGLHPKAAADKLDEDGLHKLFDAMRYVLNTAIKTEADPSKMPGDFLLPYRNKGGHCPKCGGNVLHVSACGRTAWYCPKCQGGD